MDTIDYRIAAGFVAAAVGLAAMGDAAAPPAQTRDETAQLRAKSPLPAEAPRPVRVVVTPTLAQMARIRLEKRMIGPEYRAANAIETGIPTQGARCEDCSLPGSVRKRA